MTRRQAPEPRQCFPTTVARIERRAAAAAVMMTTRGPFDTLEAEAYSPLGQSPLVLVAAGACDAARLSSDTRAVVIGTDRAGHLPSVDPASYDCLLTTASDPPAPWLSVAPARWDGHLASIVARVARAPIAAMTLVQVLRITEVLPFDLALAAESHSYSMLLAGREFAGWRTLTPLQTPAWAAPSANASVRIDREGDEVWVTLAQPENRNAFTAPMRDALFNALAAVLDDPTEPTLRLDGDGACFSAGGDLTEFGGSADVAMASAIRIERACARLLDRLGARATVFLHGACIGSGIEIPAAAGRRIARAGAWFQLPELGMGLIPGAGGCATIGRAIGRHRTAWMVLSGRRIDAATALHWRLIDEIIQ